MPNMGSDERPAVPLRPQLMRVIGPPKKNMCPPDPACCANHTKERKAPALLYSRMKRTLKVGNVRTAAKGKAPPVPPSQTFAASTPGGAEQQDQAYSRRTSSRKGPEWTAFTAG